MDILSWHIQNLISSSGVIQFLYSKTQLIHGKTPQQDSTARSLVVIYSVGRLLQFMECKLHIWVRLSTTQFVGSLNMQIAANFLLLDMQLLQICLITPTIYLHACKELKSFEKMAEALKKLDEQLICSICFDTYTDPKLLQCLHVYCQCCLESLVIRKQPVPVSYQTCRQETLIPEAGLAGLQSAFHINHFLEIRNSFRSDSASKEPGVTMHEHQFSK